MSSALLLRRVLHFMFLKRMFGFIRKWYATASHPSKCASPSPSTTAHRPVPSFRTPKSSSFSSRRLWNLATFLATNTEEQRITEQNQTLRFNVFSTCHLAKWRAMQMRASCCSHVARSTRLHFSPRLTRRWRLLPGSSAPGQQVVKAGGSFTVAVIAVRST